MATVRPGTVTCRLVSWKLVRIPLQVMGLDLSLTLEVWDLNYYEVYKTGFVRFLTTIASFCVMVLPSEVVKLNSNS